MMKSPEVQTSKSTMDLLQEKEAEIRAKVRALEGELSSKIKEQDRRKAAAQSTTARLKAELEQLEAGYIEARGKLEDEAQKDLEAHALMIDDVRSGKTSMADYLAQGTNAAEIQKKAKAAADVKMLELARLVREKRRAVIEAELEEANADYELLYLLTAPGLLWVQTLKDFIPHAEATLGGIMGGWPLCRKVRDDKEAQLHRIKNDGIAQGERWANLDEQGLRELKLNPEVLEVWFPEIDRGIEMIAGTGDRVDIVAVYNGRRQGLEIIARRVVKQNVIREYKP